MMFEASKGTHNTWYGVGVFGVLALATVASGFIVDRYLSDKEQVDPGAEVTRLSGELTIAEEALRDGEQAYTIRLDELPHDCKVIVELYVADGALKGTANQDAIDSVTDPVCGPDNVGVVGELNGMYDGVTAQQQTVDDLEWALAATLSQLGVEPTTTAG